ncbi:transcription elongation factor [Shewanella waksmanii]|uniref:transcription elongation factor n=1 Tax=Shewanella waksmanii TaxID=213783 RepID=UPI003736ADD6
MSRNKASLQQQIIEVLNQLQSVAKQAANQAHVTATHSESIARSKYETFGLEASYLAHGQTHRVAQLQQDIRTIGAMPVCHYTEDDAIDIGALVFVEDQAQMVQALFVSPCAGGVKVSFDCTLFDTDLAVNEVMLITPQSPLGQALMGQYLDEPLTIQLGNSCKLLEIIAVF